MNQWNYGIKALTTVGDSGDRARTASSDLTSPYIPKGIIQWPHVQCGAFRCSNFLIFGTIELGLVPEPSLLSLMPPAPRGMCTWISCHSTCSPTGGCRMKSSRRPNGAARNLDKWKAETGIWNEQHPGPDSTDSFIMEKYTWRGSWWLDPSAIVGWSIKSPCSQTILK